MNVPHIQQDRLGILHLGTRRLALPLFDVAYFVRATELRAVRDGPHWMAGVLAERGTGAWLPVVDLARLWDDASLNVPWEHLVVTRSGLAVGIGSYATTRVATPLLSLRPAPGNPALQRAALLEGQPIPILDVYHLVTPEQWQALAATA